MMLKQNLVKIDLKNSRIRNGVDGTEEYKMQIKRHTYHRAHHIGRNKISHTL